MLVMDPDDPQQLRARSIRRWDRLVGRFLASSLDRQLALGRPPESNRRLAARAHVLVAPLKRGELVQNWENVLVQARRPPVMRNLRVPLNREDILVCEPHIQEMLNSLVAPRPAPARGTAMVSWLLSNGEGPLYNPRRSAELVIAIREAIALLDPSVPL